MVSQFMKKKLIYVFKFFDENASGTIDKNDFELTIKNICKLRGWSASNAKYKEVESTLLTVWDALQIAADSDRDGEISMDEWITMWKMFAKNPDAPQEWQSVYCKFVFDLEDTSGDGVIDAEEFCSVYETFGINKNDALYAFEKTAKGNSCVTWLEFQELWKEYFTSEDPNAPGNFIFGKLDF